MFKFAAMDTKIKQFYGNAIAYGLCDEYMWQWKKADEDKLLLLGLSLSAPASCLYVATAISSGWGLRYKDILTDFRKHINKNDGYVSVVKQDNVSIRNSYALFMCYDEDVDLTSNVIHLCKCRGRYTLSKSVTEMCVTNDSDVVLDCRDTAYLALYLHNDVKVILDNIPIDSRITIYDYDNTENSVMCYENSERVRVRKRTYELNAGL